MHLIERSLQERLSRSRHSQTPGGPIPAHAGRLGRPLCPPGEHLRSEEVVAAAREVVAAARGVAVAVGVPQTRASDPEPAGCRDLIRRTSSAACS
jgi:hypothetical protein